MDKLTVLDELLRKLFARWRRIEDVDKRSEGGCSGRCCFFCFFCFFFRSHGAGVWADSPLLLKSVSQRRRRHLCGGESAVCTLVTDIGSVLLMLLLLLLLLKRRRRRR